jgi:hypothetical protein
MSFVDASEQSGRHLEAECPGRLKKRGKETVKK